MEMRDTGVIPAVASRYEGISTRPERTHYCADHGRNLQQVLAGKKEMASVQAQRTLASATAGR
jgi:hypothetical protein